MEVQDGFSLYVPVPEMIKPTYERLVEAHVHTPFPFWAKIWPSSKAMSAFLTLEPYWVKSKNVLEIGAGIGLPSFSIAKVANKVIVTDHSPDAVDLINKNIEHFHLDNMKAICADWNDFPEQVSTDTVLLSDVNYAPDAFGPLLTLIGKLMAEGAVIVIATPERIMAVPFVEALQPYVKRSFLHPVDDMGQSIEIRMLLLWN